MVLRGVTTVSAAVVGSAAASAALLRRHHNRSKVPEGTRYYITANDSSFGAPPLGGASGGGASWLEPEKRGPTGVFRGPITNTFTESIKGVGVAFDASTRGLKCCLIEADDFAAGTSSKSTKLIHGGIRYLQKAFEDLDWGQ
ncbi:Glycerol-3-phosphate dehydrogenase, related [Eimeria acervulina]|uniref:glycerol-3-phosphate dehydrogenase n=1 Tax=Eimeria acervulina TaxID=5801 RepID=U6GDA3_EIMAC|nr:Glycerol-3-phosphate dehydrogenase, related [Eimeria acervulina]CDI77333.1 Glycerol-3-phosphate dehydrogenase, related [Eimeria acervulina]